MDHGLAGAHGPHVVSHVVAEQGGAHEYVTTQNRSLVVGTVLERENKAISVTVSHAPVSVSHASVIVNGYCICSTFG